MFVLVEYGIVDVVMCVIEVVLIVFVCIFWLSEDKLWESLRLMIWFGVSLG